MTQTDIRMSFSEHLKTVADALESLIAEKRFLQASVLLVRSLKIVNNAEMQDVSALSDLRSYFTTQETVKLNYAVQVEGLIRVRFRL